MIPATTKRLILDPAPPVGEATAGRPDEELSRYAAAPPGVLERRLRGLDREWDVERLTAAMSGLLLLLGLLLAWFQVVQGPVFPAVVAACLLLHALVGWTPALPLLRVLGVRTAREIARERHALEAARREVRTEGLAASGQEREDLSRFENEGGSPADGVGAGPPPRLPPTGSLAPPGADRRPRRPGPGTSRGPLGRPCTRGASTSPSEGVRS